MRKIIIKLFASSWYIFLTYIYDARSHLYQIVHLLVIAQNNERCTVQGIKINDRPVCLPHNGRTVITPSKACA